MVASLYEWHQRMGHSCPQGIKRIASRNIVKGTKLSNTEMLNCPGCIIGKGHRKPFPKNKSRTSSRLLQLVHTDVMGPFEIRTLGGSRYVITFIDDFSKCCYLYLMKSKSEAFQYFKKFHALGEVHANSRLEKLMVHTDNEAMNELSGSQLRILRSDNGGEYLSTEF